MTVVVAGGGMSGFLVMVVGERLDVAWGVGLCSRGGRDNVQRFFGAREKCGD